MPNTAPPPAAEPQARVITYLTAPESYDDPPDRVIVIETHGARVFLAGACAIKIKRAIRYDYMDFSTLEKRRAALTREYEINHPNAPEIYQRVIAITAEADGTLAFDGAGEPVEWALLMTRFEQDQLLSAIAARGALDTALAERVADAIAAFHDAAAPELSPSAAARLEKTIDHLATSGLTAPAIAEADRIATWHRRALDHLETHRATLDTRAAAGARRRAHGDLHLANIVVIDGRPRLFDAIEFDDNLRTVDRLYDLAFLLMDLDAKDCRAAANTILNRYLTRPGTETETGPDTDLDALALLPLFLSLRAAIRAMVAAQRARLSSPGARHDAEREARAYFARAEAYLTPPPPRLIAIGGFSGTGKTTLARALAPDIAPPPGAVIVRSDIERKRLFGVPETTRLAADSYTQEASDRVYARIHEKARRILTAGHSVILDAVFSKAREREQAPHTAPAGVAFTGLWLEAPADTLRTRVAARTGDASDATPAIVDAQLAASQEIISWSRITAADTPAATCADARSALRLPPARPTKP